MYQRWIDLRNCLDEAIFLLGARQTGKSTLLKEAFGSELYYDLLDAEIRQRFKQNPEWLRTVLQDKPNGTLVIIDEVSKVPF